MALNSSYSASVPSNESPGSLAALLWSQAPYLIASFALLAICAGPLFKTSSKTLLLNPKKSFYDILHIGPKKSFFTEADSIIAEWLRGNPVEAARINTWDGEVVLVPPHMVHEVKNERRLSLSLWLRKAFHAHLPGFEGFQEGGYHHDVLKSTCNNQLNKNLAKFTQPLADESGKAISDIFTEDAEWPTVRILEQTPNVVARCVARVFLGEEFARNPDWIRITREYTLAGVPVGFLLRLWPVSWRPVVQWLIPGMTKLRTMMAEARQIIEPAIEKRNQQKADGKTDFSDSLEWFDESARGKDYDRTGVQVFLSVAAIHTSTDLICSTLVRLAQNPDILVPLRQEIASVLGECGWEKSSLQKLKLLDSVIKESQRMKPVAIVLRRIVLEDMTLSDGTELKKDSTVAIPSYRMWDSEFYENPEQWDGYRFLKMREEPGHESQHQLATISVDHFGFGYGRQPCPGRFYAADLVKTILVHLVMKYDFRPREGESLDGILFGFDSTFDPSLSLEFQRRTKDVSYLKVLG
ncbi:putative cytochrome P450 monooxygenase [Dactylonectria macrodidyma]|uniref:Cytochrome P450 monooxygenase n=1 Tax=Dactylonectria macrodidyma TaxID=307937 RepID=A0A9P9EBM0_9HYPO|nr:putative cytochrome P450 monooxygenase [Dactylonectria macrodidyma]